MDGSIFKLYSDDIYSIHADRSLHIATLALCLITPVIIGMMLGTPYNQRSAP